MRNVVASALTMVWTDQLVGAHDHLILDRTLPCYRHVEGFLRFQNRKRHSTRFDDLQSRCLNFLGESQVSTVLSRIARLTLAISQVPTHDGPKQNHCSSPEIPVSPTLSPNSHFHTAHTIPRPTNPPNPLRSLKIRPPSHTTTTHSPPTTQPVRTRVSQCQPRPPVGHPDAARSQTPRRTRGARVRVEAVRGDATRA
ncbi:hypothetical protein A0H81_14496 [Grifola frondosa]|uniref:Uncharacterized protein n=1 Tax=Grifola frondosa TaxID=5627 RepID=A0A1C7LNM2_GRIFR|nr:hypothetical protein A0H81_14496 [Grifola frondosa]